MRKMFICLALLLAMGSLVFGAGQNQQAAASDASNTLQLSRVGLMGGNDQLPCPWLHPTGITTAMVYDSLLWLDFDGNVAVYKLAESYTVSPDGLTYTFKIRNNVKWHDGVPFTTEDYVWSVKTMMKVPRSYSSLITGKFSNIKGMTDFVDGRAQDVAGISSTADTVTFTLNTADFTFITGIAAFAPLPKHLLEKEDPLTLATGNYWSTQSVGTGAYRLEQFVPNSYMLLKVNPDYYDEKPKIENVNVSLFLDAQAGDAFNLSGKNDFFSTTNYAMLKQLLDTGYYNSETMEINYNRHLMPNLTGIGRANNSGNTKIMDIRVRQALIYAIDHQKICDTLFEGGAIPTFSYTNEASQYFDPQYNQYTYDPEKAKQLLAEAGFDFSQKIIISTHYASDVQAANMLEAIASYWRAIGITVETLIMPAGTDAVAWLYEQKPYDFNYGGASVGKNLDLYNGFFVTNQYSRGLRGEFVGGDAFDKAMAAFLAATELDDRIAAASELQRLEAQYMPIMPLFLVPNYQVVNKRLNVVPGLLVEPNFPCYFGFEKWTLNN